MKIQGGGTKATTYNRRRNGSTGNLVYKMECISRSQIQTQENKKANINVKKLDSLNMVLEAKSHI